jgi:ABC-2 type transport system permease protein
MSTPAHYGRAFAGVLRRETLRLMRQHGRLASAIVRPLVWLVIFAAGFRSALGVSITPPYQTYILYEVYIVPGLAAMMLLFHGTQNGLAMVYDREMGSMRALLVTPLPRPYLLGARLLATVLGVLPLVYVFLLIARWFDVRPPLAGYAWALPCLLLAGLMMGAFGLFVSSLIRQLENFAGVMNFVIFPVFFASTALYPLWRLEDASTWLAIAASANPFSHAVELIRFALYGQLDGTALAVVLASLAVFFLGAVIGYDPGRGPWGRRGEA